VEEFAKTLNRYQTALLVQMQSSISGDPDNYDKEEVLQYVAAPGKSKKKGGDKTKLYQDLDNMKLAAIRLHKLINEVESMAMSLGFPYALGLIGGECMLCPECVGVGSKQGCRRPYQARPSMEGVGIDVLKTSINAGLPFEMPPKKEVIWSGLVLVD
jgi:predicted metal-binding protein